LLKGLADRRGLTTSRLRLCGPPVARCWAAKGAVSGASLLGPIPVAGPGQPPSSRSHDTLDCHRQS